MEGLGTVAYPGISSYSGSRDRKHKGSRLAEARSQPHPISTNKPGTVVHVYNHSYVEDINRRITVQASLMQNTRLYPKNN
jgi:hypothetical protein